MLSIREALEAMWPRFAPLGDEELPLLAAHGRVLAQDALARVSLPGFDHSAMDGYAVRHAELTGGVVLPVRGEARAQPGEPLRLEPASALRIFTGGRLPDGADTVVIQEDCERVGDSVQLRQLPASGANVRRAGSDLAAGALALARGSLIGPGELGLLAALDCSTVRVYRRPRVAILPTGDELRELGEPALPGTIVNSNAHSLAAAVADAGCEPLVLPIARDQAAELTARVRDGMQADVLLTLGGVSVGEYDLVGDALRAAGFAIGFHKVAIKPGKPLMFGHAGALPVVGLPGNPVSAFVTFELFVRPCLLRMRGLAHTFPELIEVELAAAARHGIGRTELARARLVRHAGRLVAELHALQGSGSLPSMAEVDVLVILPADQREFLAGTRLAALLLRTPRRETSPY